MTSNQKKLYPSRIYLLGLPSSGKSTFGDLFAQYIDYQYIDTDNMIIQEEGRSIPDIFAQDGETYFRKVEQQILHKTVKYNQVVIATGGGMPCFFDNIYKINQLGYSVFLDVKPQAIAQRITKDDASRPLLQTHNQDMILAQIQTKYQERIQFYQQAQLTLKEDEIKASILHQKITQLLNESKNDE